MIRNLTGELVCIYRPSTPAILSHAQRHQGLLDTLPPATIPAAVVAGIRGAAADVHHHEHALTIHLVTYTVTGLPDRGGDLFLVDREVALATPGRADLLVVSAPVTTPSGQLLGYRHLGSPC